MFNCVLRWPISINISSMSLKPTFIILSLLMLTQVGCGLKWKHKPNEPLKIELPDNYQCAVADQTNMILRELEPDYEVKLYSETILRVLEDLKANPQKEPKAFWGNLGPEVRNLLNFELNLYLIKNPTTDVPAVYQATALFFTAFRDTFDETHDYKIKDMKGKIYSFQTRGVPTSGPVLFNNHCGQFDKSDVSAFVLGTGLSPVVDVIEVYECRIGSDALILMELKDRLFLKAGLTVSILDAGSFRKKELKRKIDLSFSSPFAEIKIKITKNREEIEGDWKSKSSQIELRTPDYSMTGEGGCNTLIQLL